jgi:hypothetical protein
MTQERALDEEKAKVRKPNATQTLDKRHAGGAEAETSGLIRLQNQVGNQAVQRLLAQRSGAGSFELDDETTSRINRERGGGQPLESAVQKQAGAAMSQDFSDVRVHTSPKANALSRQLGARAFTTGQDIFFRDGAYDPASSSGQELIAHELTHVVQQSTGAVGGGGKMTVNPPGDAFEQEADAIAKAVTSPAATAEVQRQAAPEEEEEIQTKAIQRQVPEEEEEIQTQLEEEEEEPVQMQELEEEEVPEDLQRQEVEEEDEE